MVSDFDQHFNQYFNKSHKNAFSVVVVLECVMSHEVPLNLRYYLCMRNNFQVYYVESPIYVYILVVGSRKLY